MKTLIAIPAMDSVPTLFAQSLATLRRVGECSVAFEIGSLVYNSRNDLAKKAIEMESDYVLWLDSDMVFNPNTLELMFKTMTEKNLDILTGLYFRRVAPFTPVLFDKLEMTDEGCIHTEFKEIPDTIFEVGGCGFGCVLMKTSVFIDVFIKHQAFFTPIKGTGEDLSFCWRARDCGYKIYCDPSFFLGHVGNQIISRNFYESYKTVRAQN